MSITTRITLATSSVSSEIPLANTSVTGSNTGHVLVRKSIGGVDCCECRPGPGLATGRWSALRSRTSGWKTLRGAEGGREFAV